MRHGLHNQVRLARSYWEPLFKGSEADAVLSVVKDIGDAILPRIAIYADQESQGKRGARDNTAELAELDAGLSVCLAYAGRVLDDERLRAGALKALRVSQQRVSRVFSKPGLFTGFAGVAWATTDCSRTESPLLTCDQDFFAEIDSTLAKYLARTTVPVPYDLIDGIAGIGYYGLTRADTVSGRECSELAVRRLKDTVHWTACGAAWPTDPSVISTSLRRHYPPDSYHLGMAHGLAGVVAFLSAAAMQRVMPDECQELLEASVAFLLAHRRTGDGGAFARSVRPGEKTGDGTFTWCWGEAGIAASMLQAADALDSTKTRDIAVQVMLDLARRAPWKRGVVDLCLCHGTLGVAQVFRRFYQVTGETALRDSARDLIREAVGARRPAVGVGGYRFISVIGDDGHVEWTERDSYLTGSAGVCAVLSSACAAEEPTWDYPLGLACP